MFLTGKIAVVISGEVVKVGVVEKVPNLIRRVNTRSQDVQFFYLMPHVHLGH